MVLDMTGIVFDILHKLKKKKNYQSKIDLQILSKRGKVYIFTFLMTLQICMLVNFVLLSF
jgi:hypothetical protein